MADFNNIFEVTGNGDVVEPESGVLAIGSGGNYAQGEYFQVNQSLYVVTLKLTLFLQLLLSLYLTFRTTMQKPLCESL